MRRHVPSVTLFTLLLLAGSAHADLQDEIQVYDDAINSPGEFGVELHVNGAGSNLPFALQFVCWNQSWDSHQRPLGQGGELGHFDRQGAGHARSLAHEG